MSKSWTKEEDDILRSICEQNPLMDFATIAAIAKASGGVGR